MSNKQCIRISNTRHLVGCPFFRLPRRSFCLLGVGAIFNCHAPVQCAREISKKRLCPWVCDNARQCHESVCSVCECFVFPFLNNFLPFQCQLLSLNPCLTCLFGRSVFHLLGFQEEIFQVPYQVPRISFWSCKSINVKK